MNIVRELDAIISRHKVFMQELSSSMGYTIDVGESLEQLNQPDKVKDMENVMCSYIEMEKKIENHIKLLEELKSSAQRSRNDAEVKLSAPFAERVVEVQKAQAPDPQKHSKYREFRQKIWHVHHANEGLPEDQNEEVIAIAPQEDPTICPITRKELEEPMRNDGCRHVYSRQAIELWIKTKKGGRRGAGVSCPVAGCNHVVSNATLKFDKELQRKLERNKKRKATQGTLIACGVCANAVMFFTDAEPDDDEEQYTQL